MNRNAWCAGLTLSLAVFMASGTPVSGKPAPGPGTVVAPSPTQRASIQRAFAWQGRDAGLLDRGVPITERFVAIPRVQERNAQMVAKVRTRADMAVRAAGELAAAPIDNGAKAGVGLRGAQARTFGDVWARADERLVEARQRLAPSLVAAYDEVDVHSFRLPEGWTEEEVAAVLMATGDYEYVEPDWRVYPLATTPNDPQFNQQWHHRAQNMNTVRAWDFATGGPDIIVAICDTGVRKSHVDLTTFVPGLDATTSTPEADGGNTDDIWNGHGTMVAGSAAARGNNGTGVAGVGWNFSIMPVRVSNRHDGDADLSVILLGARWAALNGAFVANCSYGGANSNQATTTGNFLRERDALLVFASGNDGLHSQTVDRANVTIVGASTQNNSVAGFSDYGQGIDLVAPGVSIRTTTRGGSYTFTQGTSFSAPLVAGAAALVRAAAPDLSATEIEELLFLTATDVGAPGRDIYAGHGVVNVGLAVEQALLGVSVMNLPFEDDFTDGLDLWPDTSGSVSIVAAPPGLPAGHAMNLSGDASATTPTLRAYDFLDDVVQVAFGYAHRGVEAGETLTVEYLDFLSNWQTLGQIESDGADDSDYERARLALPVMGRHDGLKIRVVADGSDQSDDWYLADFLVAEFVRNDLPWQTGFETGLDLDFDWESAAGVSVTGGASNIPEGDTVARLAGSAYLVSRPVDVTDAAELPWVRLRTQHVGVPAGQALTVEFRNFSGQWADLGEIVSTGQDQSAFDLHQFQVPVAGFGTDFAIRISTEGASSGQVWHVDDVAVTTEFLTEQPECPADLDGSGTVDIFDLLAFANAYTAQEPAGDWNGDSQWDVFDLLAFLDDFQAGCP